MKRSDLLICSVLAFLGILSAALGFAAEVKHIRPDQVRKTESGRCIYPKSPALPLAITAAFALLMAQVIINLSAGCICCGRSRNYYKSSYMTIAIVCLVVSWITFVIAFVLLLAGAALNDQHSADMRDFELEDVCYVVKNGVFSGGAVLALATVTLGIICHTTAAAVKSASEWSSQHPNIAMAQPRHQQQTDQPVFVPEPAYA